MNLNIVRHYINLILVVITGYWFSPLNAQDVVFSQFYNAPIQLNPGLVGLSNSPYVAINYRDQWIGWGRGQGNNGGYKTYSASYDQFFEPLNSGLGIQILSDDSGDGILTTNKLSGVYAYRLQINRKFQARVGLEASITQQRLDWDQLTFFDQIIVGSENLLPSGEVRPDNLTNAYFDFSMGGVLYNDKFYIGLSLKHLNAPNNSVQSASQGIYAGLPSRLTIHGGWQIDLDGYNNDGFGSFFAPSVLLVRQSDLSQLNAGGLYNKENFFVGAWLRYDFSNIDAAIFSAGWRTKWLKLSYSFDLTLSSAGILNTAGSHEIGIIMNFGALQNPPSRYEDCFSIFR